MAFICGALGVSRSGFYEWLRQPTSAPAHSNGVLAREVRKSFVDSGRTYGARRGWYDVLEAGLNCGLHAVERLKQDNALKAHMHSMAEPSSFYRRSHSLFERRGISK